MYLKNIYIFFTISLMAFKAQAWGFYAHRLINRQAVFCLPAEMSVFFKRHLHYLSQSAVNPDRRRYVLPEEAPRHYIDLEVYGDSARWKLPLFWKEAVDKYTQDSLMAYGIVPWHINKVHYQLTEAFKARDASKILKLAADLGHYISDANVPLHTSINYDGQLTDQRGIHGLWESRLVELFSGGYSLFTGPAAYLDKAQERAWQAVWEAHAALDSVLSFEKELSRRFPEDKRYGFENRNGLTVKVYSREYAQAYHQMLGQQVSLRMRASIRMVADFWFTCWVNAGQPDLKALLGKAEPQEEDSMKPLLRVRPHEGGFAAGYVCLQQDCCPLFRLSPAILRKRTLPRPHHAADKN
jgi:hypothetical protein